MISGGMPVRMRVALVVGCLFAALAAGSRADAAVTLQPVGTFNDPINIASPPGDPRLFVVERAGTIEVVHDGTASQFLDISSMVRNTGEQGLLSMAFDPNYATNGLFYVFFTDNGTGGAGVGDNHVEEFRVSGNPNVADRASRRPVLTIDRPDSTTTNHNGGQLQFGKDGLLYISVGDDANGSNAQTLANPHGKILRIDPHGAGSGAHGIPSTNPFTTSPTPEIWSMGLRNPFRFSFDHLTGDLVIADVGQNTWEEIDLNPSSSGLARGANFGWPDCEGFVNQGTSAQCSLPGATRPVFAYPHDNPGGGAAFGCAIIGGFVYRGSQIPELVGRYLYTDNCHGQLRSIQLGIPFASGDRAESAPDALSGPQSFGEDSSCNLYVTDGDTVDKIIGSGTGASVCAGTTPACAKCPPGKKGKKCRHKRKKKRAAVSKKHTKHKKHKKKCHKKHKKHKKKRVA
jgi:glucose/arabinose dehydrogenase